MVIVDELILEAGICTYLSMLDYGTEALTGRVVNCLVARSTAPDLVCVHFTVCDMCSQIPITVQLFCV